MNTSHSRQQKKPPQKSKISFLFIIFVLWNNYRTLAVLFVLPKYFRTNPLSQRNVCSVRDSCHSCKSRRNYKSGQRNNQKMKIRLSVRTSEASRRYRNAFLRKGNKCLFPRWITSLQYACKSAEPCTLNRANKIFP